MELVQVRITSTVITQHYGTLMPGTILRTSAAYAKHLVEEASAAKYISPVAVAAEPDPVAGPAKPAKRKKAAEADTAPAGEAQTEQSQ